ncbi:MAG: DUF1292 domain-containing protein [Eubacteriales bacterium]
METKNTNTGEEDNIVELIDEDGNNLKMEHVLTFEHEDKVYVAFVPIDDNEKEEEEEVVLMRLDEDENGEELFTPIEDDDEMESAWEAFLNIYYSGEDYEDDDEDSEEEEEE